MATSEPSSSQIDTNKPETTKSPSVECSPKKGSNISYARVTLLYSNIHLRLWREFIDFVSILN